MLLPVLLRVAKGAGTLHDAGKVDGDGTSQGHNHEAD